MSEIKSYIQQTLALTGRELKHWYRSKMQIIMALIQPLVWLGLFGLSMSGFIQGMGIDYFSYLAMGMIVITALSTAMNSGMSLVWDRRLGFLDKLRAAPIPRGIIPLSKVLSTTVKAVVQSMLVLVIALLLGLNLAPGFGIVDILVILFTVIMVALIFSSVFVSLGLVIRNQEVLMGVNMLLNLPLMFASGAMFPTASFPDWLQAVANANPLTYAADAVRRVAITVDPSMLMSISLGEDLMIMGVTAFAITALGMFFARRGLKA